MSLRTIHLLFVAACAVLCLFFGYWALSDYRTTRSLSMLTAGLSMPVAVAALVYYGLSFRRRCRTFGLR